MEDKAKIIRKIERCLALGNSANKHEAAAALRQAKALMNKYQIEQADLGLSGIEIAQQTGAHKSRPLVAWKQGLAATVAMAFRCSVVSAGGRVVFVGESPAPTIALYALESLERQLEKNKKQFMDSLLKYLDEKGVGPSLGDKIMLGKGYCEGWVKGCALVVNKFAEDLTGEEQQKHERVLREKFKRETKEAKKPKLASDGELGRVASEAGVYGGLKAKLHHGMGQDRQENRLLVDGL